MNSSASISAIDVHGHYGVYTQVDKTELYNRMMSGDDHTLHGTLEHRFDRTASRLDPMRKTRCRLQAA